MTRRAILGWGWAFVVFACFIESHPISFPAAFHVFPNFEAWKSVAPGIIAALAILIGGHGWLSLIGVDPRSVSGLAAAIPAGVLFVAFFGTIAGFFWSFSRLSSLVILFSLVVPFFFTIRNIPWKKWFMTFGKLLGDRYFFCSFLGVMVLAYVNLMGTMLPDTAYDDQLYHLTIPKLFIEKGNFRSIPELQPSMRPLNLHILYTLIGTFGENQSMRVINWFIGVFSSFLLMGYVGIRISPIAGSFSGFGFYLIPQIGILSMTAYTDMVVVFLSVAGSIILFENSFEATHNNPRGPFSSSMICLGVVAALAPGVKVSGIFISLFIICGIVFNSINSAKRLPLEGAQAGVSSGPVSPVKIFKEVAIVIMAISFFSSPWFFRNWKESGNPLYPHLGQVWNSRPPPEALAFLETFHREPDLVYDFSFLMARFGMGSDFLSLIKLPWNIFVNSHVHDQNWSLQYFDGEISFLPLIFLPFFVVSLFSESKPAGMKLLFGVVYALFIAWGLGSQQIRFILPAVAILTAILGWWLSTEVDLHGLAIAALAIAFLYTFSTLAGRVARGGDFLSGKISSEKYLESRLPFYAAYSFMKELPEKATVLPLFEERVYYLPRPFLWMELVPKYFIAALQTADSPGEVSNYLKRLGIDFLYIPRHGLFALMKILEDEQFQKNVQEFFRSRVEEVYQDSQGIVFKVKL